MPTHTLRIKSDYDDGTRTFSNVETFTLTGGSYIFIDEVIPDGSTDLQVTFACDDAVANARLFYMIADGALTVETNSGSTPDDTFTLTANNAVWWAKGQQAGEDSISRVLSAAITTDIFVTNSSGGNVRLTIHCLEDPTP